MKRLRLVLLAALLMVPFVATTAHAQVSVGIGIGPAVVAAPYAYGPPVCQWGYYPYAPYSCAPYGYYGPTWFVGGVFIGAGPWYHWGWGHGWGHYYGGGYYHSGWGGPHPVPYGGGYHAYGGVRTFNGGGYRGGFAGGGHVGGGFGGGGFHGGGGGSFHGGGGHR